MNCLTSIFVLFACLAFAQDPATIRLKIVKSTPFSAQVKTESIQTLADGNRVTHTGSAWIARDSEGRTRREQVGSGIVFITDPLLGVAYVLDTHTHSARKYALPGAEADSAQKTSPAPNSEALGTNTVEGMPVDGTRQTRVIAVGEAGNERSIELTAETWYSSDLQIIVSSRTLDPSTGESTYKLTNVKRVEPDHALFEVPAGNTIQDATGK